MYVEFRGKQYCTVKVPHAKILAIDTAEFQNQDLLERDLGDNRF